MAKQSKFGTTFTIKFEDAFTAELHKLMQDYSKLVAEALQRISEEQAKQAMAFATGFANYSPREEIARRLQEIDWGGPETFCTRVIQNYLQQRGVPSAEIPSFRVSIQKSATGFRLLLFTYSDDITNKFVPSRGKLFTDHVDMPLSELLEAMLATSSLAISTQAAVRDRFTQVVESYAEQLAFKFFGFADAEEEDEEDA